MIAADIYQMEKKLDVLKMLPYSLHNDNLQKHQWPAVQLPDTKRVKSIFLSFFIEFWKPAYQKMSLQIRVWCIWY